MKSENLFDLADICRYFGLSESSVRRRIRDSRESNGATFPLPLFERGQRLLWRRCDVEAWRGKDAEAVALAPSPMPLTSSAK